MYVFPASLCSGDRNSSIDGGHMEVHPLTFLNRESNPCRRAQRPRRSRFGLLWPSTLRLSPVAIQGFKVDLACRGVLVRDGRSGHPSHESSEENPSELQS